jgi:hypothetical protein
MKRGQGAFEYILMLSGVLLVVILIILIMQSSLASSNNTLSNNLNTERSTVSIQLVNHKTLNLTIGETTGNIAASNNFPCCANGAQCVLSNGTAWTRACTYTSGTSLDCPSKYYNNVTDMCG